MDIPAKDMHHCGIASKEQMRLGHQWFRIWMRILVWESEAGINRKAIYNLVHEILYKWKGVSIIKKTRDFIENGWSIIIIKSIESRPHKATGFIITAITAVSVVVDWRNQQALWKSVLEINGGLHNM